MAAVPAIETQRETALSAQLHIAGNGAVPLAKSVINIGRESSNDVVISDTFVSRHHIQLRKRFGAYTLFDVNSRGGTRVNGTLVSEHRLQNGDLICIGRTELLYTEDTQHIASNGATQQIQPD